MDDTGPAASLLPPRRGLSDTYEKVNSEDKGKKSCDARSLLKAITDGNWDLIFQVCKSDPNLFDLLLTENADTTLHLLVARAPLLVFSRLFEHIPQNRLKVNSEGNTILHLAASRGDDKLLALVFPLINDPTIKNGKGETGLYLSGNLQCFKRIWDNFNYKGRESEPRTLESCIISETRGTILHSAIQDGLLKLAHFIVDNVPKLIDMKNEKLETPLHILAKHPGFFSSGSAHSSVVKSWSPSSTMEAEARSLLSKILRFYCRKDDVDKRPNPWNDCDSISKVNIASADADADAKPEVKIEKIPNPIVLAMNRGLYEVVQEIVGYFPGVLEDNSAGKRLIFIAAGKRNSKILEFLIKAVQRDSMFLELQEGGNNILHLAGNFYNHKPWERYDSFVQMQLEIKWFQLVQSLVPEKLQFAANDEGKYADEVFNDTHADLVAKSAEWVESAATVGTIMVSALTSSTIVAFFSYTPGGYDNQGIPTLISKIGFTFYNYFSVISIVLGLSSMVAFVNARFSCSSKCFSSTSSFEILLGMKLSYAALWGILGSIGMRRVLSDQGWSMVLSTSLYVIIIAVFLLYSVTWQWKKYMIIYRSTNNSLQDFDDVHFEQGEGEICHRLNPWLKGGQNIIAEVWGYVRGKLVGTFTNRRVERFEIELV